MITVTTNMMALNSMRSLKVIGDEAAKSSEKVATGLRINRAADDASNLAIATKMNAQIRGLNRADTNILDGMSLLNVADGGMSRISDMLNRSRELIIQGMNDTNTPEDKAKINLELNQLTAEIDAEANSTQFNRIPLLNVPKTRVESTDNEDTEDVKKPPAGGHKSYISNFDLAHISNENTLKRATFAEDNIQNYTYYKPEGGSVSFSGNIESYMLDAEPNITNLIRDSLYEKDKSGDTVVNKTVADKIAKITADALGKVFRKQFGDDSINFDGKYNTTTGILSFTITSPDDSYFNMTNCQESDDANFGHNFLHVLMSPGGVEPVPEEESDDNDSTSEAMGWDLYIQNGANEKQGVYITRYDCRAKSLDIDPLGVDPLDFAKDSLDRVDNAVETINTYRATVGAEYNRLQHSDGVVVNASLNLSDAKSRILDTDMAKESMRFTKSNTLKQAAMAMLGQANQSPQRVLELLK